MAGNKSITVIPARSSVGHAALAEETTKLRVAAYCRVSTDNEEQATSYEAQIEHYTSSINSNPDWEPAGIFADDGISGTSTRKRDEFNRMIGECMTGNIDMVITKSISRFARNTLDCLKYIRMLKERNIPVFFEKENINTLDSKGEILLTIMASLAQQESQSLSQNVKLGIQYRFQQGEMHINSSRFLGYTKDEHKRLVIVPEEAEVIRRIFKEYLEGTTIRRIALGLEADGVRTGAGKGKWYRETVKTILKNEKYIGDALLQKTYTVDFLTKKRVANSGIVPQYYVENSHEAIIPKDLYVRVQEEMARRATLRSGEDNCKRQYSTKSALAGIVYCGECGEIYRRVHWNNRGRRSIVWRCVSRLEGKGECSSPTVTEEKLQQCVVRAINMAMGDKTGFLAVLQKNIEAVLDEQQGMEAEGIDARLDELQRELLRRVNSGEQYSEIAKEILRLRELKIKGQALRVTLQDNGQRLETIMDFLSGQTGVIVNYDDELVKGLAERIIIFMEKISVTLVSGLESNVEL
jgi:DNA invertase Pin-like site-specific DNA recombinase